MKVFLITHEGIVKEPLGWRINYVCLRFCEKEYNELYNFIRPFWLYKSLYIFVEYNPTLGPDRICRKLSRDEQRLVLIEDMRYRDKKSEKEVREFFDAFVSKFQVDNRFFLDDIEKSKTYAAFLNAVIPELERYKEKLNKIEEFFKDIFNLKDKQS